MAYSETFLEAVEEAIKDEGWDKVTTDPDDPGGKTKWGISTRFMKAIGDPRDVETLTKDDAIALYDAAFWEMYHLDFVAEHCPRIAKKVFNFMITAGPSAAFICLQRAMTSCGFTIADDGVFGAESRTTFVRLLADPSGYEIMHWGLLCAFKSEIAGYYRDLDKPKYEKGWVARAYRG